MTIFTLGSIGSNSHLATQKYFTGIAPNQIQFLDTITDIFLNVQKNKNSFGLVPLENLIEGTVRETFDLLLESNLYIFDTIELDIQHCLCSQNKKFSKIVSHEQALAQCRQTLHKLYKKIPTEKSRSTSEACQLALENPNIAAVANPFAANFYNLQIQNPDINDYQENKTKFAIIHSKPNSKTSLNTIAALIPNNSDEPGLLIKMLFPFQENNVNLTKIESRPNKKNLHQYIFYIEFEGDARQARARKILTYLEKDLQICTIKTFGGQVTPSN